MGLYINLVHFALVNLVELGDFTTILGGWVVGGWVVRQIKNKDQLSPAEADISAMYGKIIKRVFKRTKFGYSSVK